MQEQILTQARTREEEKLTLGQGIAMMTNLRKRLEEEGCHEVEEIKALTIKAMKINSAFPMPKPLLSSDHDPRLYHAAVEALVDSLLELRTKPLPQRVMILKNYVLYATYSLAALYRNCELQRN